MPHKCSIRTYPTEMITEILCRLPSKSVGRFRCVSKGWLSLLTEPAFIKTHQHTLNRNHLIFDSTLFRKTSFRADIEGWVFLYSHPFHYHEVISTPTKFHLDYDYYGCCDDLCISGSCDGLVFVRVANNGSTESLLLVNPTIRETLELPEDYCDFLYGKCCGCYQTDIMYGFGYDSVTNDYKVVTPIYFSYKYCSGNHYFDDDDDQVDLVEAKGVYVYVYSLKSNTWRRVIDSPYNYSESSDGVFVIGFIHWIVSKGRSHDDLLAIAAFSLADESFSEVPFPKFCNPTDDMLNKADCQLVDLDGKLAIFLQTKGEVWLMHEYGVRESWTKILLHGINEIPVGPIPPLVFSTDKGLPLAPIPYTKPLVLDDNGIILVAKGDRMMVYDVRKGTFSQTVCVWNPSKFWVIGAYVESLVSPKLNITK